MNAHVRLTPLDLSIAESVGINARASVRFLGQFAQACDAVLMAELAHEPQADRAFVGALDEVEATRVKL